MLRTRLGALLGGMQAGIDSSRFAGCALALVLTPVAAMSAFLAAALAFPDTEWVSEAAVVASLVGCPAVLLLRGWLRRRTLVREGLTGCLQLDGDDLRAAQRMLSEDPDPCEACTLALAYLDRQAQLAGATDAPGPQEAGGPGTAATGF